MDEVSAYWETKPKNGDVITISRFKLKDGAKVNCSIIRKEKTATHAISHSNQEIYFLLEDFFVDVFSLEVVRERPRDYVFSAVLSSEQLFYRIASKNNIEAIIYPSVQRKKYGRNFAIKNDLILEKYDLTSVETKFILDEYENLDPSSGEPTTDSLIGSFGTEVFDFENGKILYSEDASRIFKLFRSLQIGDGKQIRMDNPGGVKNIAFNLSPTNKRSIPKTQVSKVRELGRNDKISVAYSNGTEKLNVKFKLVMKDLEKGVCNIIIE
jgi:hypothetical protein